MVSNEENQKSIHSHISIEYYNALKTYCKKERKSFRVVLKEALTIFLKIKSKQYRLVDMRLENLNMDDEDLKIILGNFQTNIKKYIKTLKVKNE
jgi:molybdopterin-guanine dinucleotide biosynthesis protein A